MKISIQYSDNSRIRKAQKIGLWTVVGLAGAVVFGVVFGLLIQFLWNATLSEMFGFPTLSFWQAIGLFILAKLFFGFGAGGNSSAQKRKKESSDKRLAVESEDVPELADESFKKYWQEEGKQSYEAFRRDRRKNDAEES